MNVWRFPLNCLFVWTNLLPSLVLFEQINSKTFFFFFFFGWALLKFLENYEKNNSRALFIHYVSIEFIDHKLGRLKGELILCVILTTFFNKHWIDMIIKYSQWNNLLLHERGQKSNKSQYPTHVFRSWDPNFVCVFTISAWNLTHKYDRTGILITCWYSW